MTNRVSEALDILRTEYLKINSNTARIEFREEIQSFLIDLRNEMVNTEFPSEPVEKDIEKEVKLALATHNQLHENFVMDLDGSIRLYDMCQTLGLDELDWIESIMYLEDEFQVDYATEFEYISTNSLTLNDLIKVILNK